MFIPPPRQSSLPETRERKTAFQTFANVSVARVEKTDDYETKGKIEVLFINRTKPAPIWVFNGPKPEVGDYVLVGFIDGQKNNPYMEGLFAHKAWTSNFIRVEKDMIRIQFPTNDLDVTGDNPDRENDPLSHLRDDGTYLESRVHIQIDASGMKINVPEGLPLEVVADTLLVRDAAGGTARPLARQGDSVSVSTTSGSGTITGASSRIQST